MLFGFLRFSAIVNSHNPRLYQLFHRVQRCQGDAVMAKLLAGLLILLIIGMLLAIVPAFWLVIRDRLDPAGRRHAVYPPEVHC